MDIIKTGVCFYVCFTVSEGLVLWSAAEYLIFGYLPTYRICLTSPEIPLRLCYTAT